MTNYREILRLMSMGISQRSIAVSCGCSRNTVANIARQIEHLQIDLPSLEQRSNQEIQGILYPDRELGTLVRRTPNCEYIHKELAKSGVTLTLLWQEYCDECKSAKQIPLMYTQFCNHYRKYANISKATMHIHRKPAEEMEVDWAGQTGTIYDRDTGETSKVYIFVSVLPSSQYAYVEAFEDQKIEAWISAHVHAFSFFGGVAKTLIPDNLKTGVIKASFYSPELNPAYQEMAEHYGTVILPARVKKPKDKASVEGAVGVISTWILASLRNEKFFGIEELNLAIQEKLCIFNDKKFQKKIGSRRSTFLAEEKFLLQPLPIYPYELSVWKTATVQFNYHISVDKSYYSVPYEYIGHQVDVRMTRKIIEIFFHGHRICSHTREYGHPGQYITTIEHMPENHQASAKWDEERFLCWAKTIGPNTQTAIAAILSVHKVKQQGYRACMGVLKLADKYSVLRLEEACKRAFTYTPSPSYKNIQSILKSGQDKILSTTQESSQQEEKKIQENHSYTRGANYYGGNLK